MPVQPEDALTKPSWSTAPAMTIDTSKTYMATVKTDVGTFTDHPGPRSMAPKTVNSFVFLADHDFFNCVIFHRVIPGFVDPGRRPDRDRAPEGPATSSPTSCPRGGPPQYPLGVGGHGQLSRHDPNTNGSQFFIVTGSQGEQLPAELRRCSAR